MPLWKGYQINELINQGATPAEIAQQIGCTVGTLRVRCSQLKIQLRRKARIKQQRFDTAKRRTKASVHRLTLELPTAVAERLRGRAALAGTADSELASQLIEAVVRDDLYDAVLDSR